MGRGSKEYLCWLMNQAGMDAEGPDGYLELCTVLHTTLFNAIIDADENRIADAEDLRMEWAQSQTDNEQEQDLLAYGIDMEMEDSCSMMELLVILSRMMAYEMMESEYEAGTGKWFKEMLGNSGLDEMTNELFDVDRTGDILLTINLRKFGRDGEGGFFPLVYAVRDQRKIEIMDQMNDYLMDNYDIC